MRAYQLVKDLNTVKQGKATPVHGRSGKCLTRWTEYCSELNNYKANGDPSVLNCTQTDTEDNHPILRKKKVEAAVQPLKKKKKKESYLDSTASQQDWSKQVERV